MRKTLKHAISSGNVYEDLGFKDSEERMAKARLALCITEIIEHRGLIQDKAAKILDINQPKVSALMSGQLSGFSIERLIKFLNKLDQDVEIVIKPHKSKKISSLSIAHFSVRYIEA